MVDESIKIRIWLPEGEWHGCQSETIWVRKNKEGRVFMDNSPHFAKGLSYRDEVELVEQNDEWVFAKLVKSSGHATYRIILNPGVTHDQFLENWSDFERLGCSYEECDFLKNPLYAVDVPPTSDIEKVYGLLERGEKHELWGFDEGNFPKTLN